MAQTIDILDLLFNKLLRINPSIISKYTTPQQQLLNLFLIPHIILFLFIYGFAWVLVPTHKGLRYLASIGAYLSIVLMGSPYSYYGMLLPIFLIWWQIALVVGLFFFVWSRIINPSRSREIFNIGRDIGRKATEKSKKQAAVRHKIESINHQIQALQQRQNQIMGQPPHVRNSVIDGEIAELERRRAELESEL
jgi:hypothetical protein